jgi:hypothetical protein
MKSEHGVVLFPVQHEINVYARSQYCEERLLAPSCLLVSLSIRPPGRPHGTAWLALTDFRGIDYYFQSSVEKIQFFLIGQEQQHFI